ncbi:uncharacterized protein LOC142987242 [Anticarsia gemmatalis]|uniref:uncharacterized protein LOC142987242 n=1 Tax=Anticarsia gemmatalis TaxID=129554 RepID=UPI003F7615FD
MRTMASVWVSVIVLLAVNEVFGNKCWNLKNSNDVSCDDCIRCGGMWCRNRDEIQCVMSRDDNWCRNDQESLKTIAPVDQPGDLVVPAYAERTLYINSDNVLKIKYTARTNDKAKIETINSTQPGKITFKDQPAKCSGHDCVMILTATPRTDFCSSTGSDEEYVFVKITVGGLDESVMVKYHVPCACGCSKTVEQNSESCNQHGNKTCGVCACNAGWTGADCSKPIGGFTKGGSVKGGVKGQTVIRHETFETGSTRPYYASTRPNIPVSIPDVAVNTTTNTKAPVCSNRGDIPSCRSPINDLKCAGNGYCNECDECICYQDREGYQYFDPKEYCADLCMIVESYCDSCLLNSTMGMCDECSMDNKVMYRQKYNASLLEERDSENRKMWVKCNETINECLITYVAKMDESGNITLMVVESCEDAITDAVVAGPKVPIILGVLGILAAVAAVAGVLIWKHMNALPPVPLNDPGYQNIDAEDCIGENPLYKPPTSSFKNPTYGKW